MYEIPLIFLIGWRGYLSNDAPEHKKIGKIQPELIKNCRIKITNSNGKKLESTHVYWALKQIREKNLPCALIVN